MTNEFPLVTLGLTCFNADDTIARAIESALAQDYPNTEIIIVNDCSTDDSVAVINAAIQNAPHARLINHPQNAGFAGALNTIIQNAKGEFIAIMDDDDISLPHRISTQYKTIIAYEQKSGAQYLACWGSGYKLYDNGYRAPFQAIGSRPDVPVGRDLIECQLYMPRKPNVFFGCGTPSCSVMVRKRIYDEIGLYDTTMRRTEDTDFAIRLALKGGHFIGCPEEVVVQSASTGFDKRPEVGYKSEIALVTKYKDLFENPERFDYAKDWIMLRFHHFGRDRLGALKALLKLFIKYPVWTCEQFLRSAPKRLIHEWKMARKKAA
jgi:glycosyltransferase involved in cell wall biosynthesis